MKFEEHLADNTVFIVPNNIKNKLLEIVNNYPLLNIRIITITELSRKLIFNYDEKTIHFIMRFKNISYKNALEYIKNLYYLNDSVINDKINELLVLKNELDNNNLLIYDKYFLDSLNNKNVYVYGFDYLNKFEKYLINRIAKKNDVSHIEEKQENYNHKVLNFNNINEEIEYIANEILNNIKDGASLNNIYIANYNLDYHLTIKRIFNLYNIPINYKEDVSLYDTKTGLDFLNNLDNYEEELKKIDNNNIYNSIINILNKYYWTDDYNSVKELLIEEFKMQKVNTTQYKNAVNIIDLKNNFINDNDYIYLIGFSDQYIPSLYKDNDFFSDIEKNDLLETTPEKNKIEKEIWIKIIKKIKNLKITYSNINLKKAMHPSVLIDNFEEIKMEYNASLYSHQSNEFNLALLYEDLIKYDFVHKEMPKLKFNYKSLKYLTDNNCYKQINPKLIKDYFNKGLSLSYTKLNSYFECSFKYYLEYILKLSLYEEKFETYLGNLTHHILSKIYDSDFNFEKEKDIFIQNNYFKFTEENLVFIDKMMIELKFAIKYLQEHYNDTSFQSIECEKNIKVEKDNEIKIIINGIIDKIMRFQNKVAIVDYKTYTSNTDLSIAHYGLKSQLPIYIYLVKNAFPDVDITGIYLQGITRNILTYNPKKTLEQLKKENLKLVGYTIDNEKTIEEFDRTYIDSQYIKNMKLTSKGFSHYTKTLNNDAFNSLFNLADTLIENASKNILNANFAINPKILDRKNLSCTYCKYKSICFVNYDNYQHITADKDLSFLGGGKNELDR